MSNDATRPRPMRQKRPVAKHAKRLQAVACAAILTSANAAASQQATTHYAGQRNVLPEVILAPMQVNAEHRAGRGWMLIYRNTLSGPETPDVALQSRRVVLAGLHGPQHAATVFWEILRTPNVNCRNGGAGPCPDRIRVLSVPEGFQAVPEAAWVNEGTVLTIRIIPVLLG